MFHRNPLRGFGAPGGRNLPIPITLAIGFYNSLHYRASRDFKDTLNNDTERRAFSLRQLSFLISRYVGPQHAAVNCSHEPRYMRNSKINSMLVLICYAKLLRPIVNNGIYAI